MSKPGEISTEHKLASYRTMPILLSDKYGTQPEDYMLSSSCSVFAKNLNTTHAP